MSHIGYARVSTLEQDPALQVDALAGVGCAPIFEDRVSGARADQPGLQQALDYARERVCSSSGSSIGLAARCRI